MFTSRVLPADQDTRLNHMPFTILKKIYSDLYALLQFVLPLCNLEHVVQMLCDSFAVLLVAYQAI